MDKTYLFPHSLRKVGYALICVAFIWLVCTSSFIFPSVIDVSYPMFSLATGMFDNPDKWFDPHMVEGSWFEIFMTLMCVGCAFVVFSKEKDEDECIAQIRMNALVWSMLVNLAFVLLSTLFIFGGSYFVVMAIYPFSTFFVFMIKYNLSLYKFRKSNEE